MSEPNESSSKKSSKEISSESELPADSDIDATPVESEKSTSIKSSNDNSPSFSVELSKEISETSASEREESDSNCARSGVSATSGISIPSWEDVSSGISKSEKSGKVSASSEESCGGLFTHTP